MRAARSVPRLNRAKADKLLTDFLQSVEEVNAHPDLLHWVTEVRVFGSYLANSDDLGEIDLAIKRSGGQRGALLAMPIRNDWWRDCSKVARGTSRCTTPRNLMKVRSLAARRFIHSRRHSEHDRRLGK